jgi:hypothetical protein
MGMRSQTVQTRNPAVCRSVQLAQQEQMIARWTGTGFGGTGGVTTRRPPA